MERIERLSRGDVLEFFEQGIREGMGKVDLELEDETVAYLSNVMWKYVESDVDGLEDLGFDRPVAMQVLEALECGGDQSIGRYVDIGELSVINCAFFEEYLTRRSMSVEYYIGIGKHSYLKLSQWYRKHGMDMVDVFRSVAMNMKRVIKSVRNIQYEI